MKKYIVVLTCLVAIMFSGTAFGGAKESFEAAREAFGKDWAKAISLYTQAIKENEKEHVYSGKYLGLIYHDRGTSKLGIYLSHSNGDDARDIRLLKEIILDLETALFDYAYRDFDQIANLVSLYMELHLKSPDDDPLVADLSYLKKSELWSYSGIMMEPSNYKSYFERCILYTMLKDIDFAIKNCKAAVSLQPNDTEIQNVLGSLILARDAGISSITLNGGSKSILRQ